MRVPSYDIAELERGLGPRDGTTGVMTGRDFKVWRARMGVSQRKAADMLGLALRTITAYEIEETSIPLSVEYACEWILTGKFNK